MKTFKTISLLLLLSMAANAQLMLRDTELKTETGNLFGTLLSPYSNKKIPVVLIIAGSGPTDRDGNVMSMTNNSLKMLAEDLQANGIASLRYDKRGVGASQKAMLPEKDLRFDHYVEDAIAWANFLKTDARFSDLIVLGHSEGSLIGMKVAQAVEAEKYISLAGAGKSANKVLREQLSAQNMLEKAEPILQSLEGGKTIAEVPATLNSIFRPSIQPYLISWFQYDPQVELKKISSPILIVQGTTDIQVSVDQANLLAKANTTAHKVIIEGMNHVLKTAPTDRAANIATYSNPSLPLHSELMPSIIKFIKE